jgi:hypothetical protein
MVILMLQLMAGIVQFFDIDERGLPVFRFFKEGTLWVKYVQILNMSDHKTIAGFRISSVCCTEWFGKYPVFLRLFVCCIPSFSLCG